MARHTIGYKRGSVRGAPPDVYLPFGNFADGDEPWDEAVKLSKHFGIGVIIMAIVGVLTAILVGLGFLPEEFVE